MAGFQTQVPGRSCRELPFLGRPGKMATACAHMQPMYTVGHQEHSAQAERGHGTRMADPSHSIFVTKSWEYTVWPTQPDLLPTCLCFLSMTSQEEIRKP